MRRWAWPAAIGLAALSVGVGLGVAVGAVIGPHPSHWVDTAGRPAAVTEEGGGSCLDGTTLLRYKGLQYLRDPDHRVDRDLARPFEPSVELSSDAQFTGFHDRERELWVRPLEQGTAVYVVTSQGTERWPVLTLGCV